MQLKSILLALTFGFANGGAISHLGERPNIVFILTDDQDTHMNSLDYMPYLQKHLIKEGTNFERHYCTGTSMHDAPSSVRPISNLLSQLRYVAQVE